MERIIIELDDVTGKKWNLAPSNFKKEITDKVSESITRILDENIKVNFLTYLDEIGEKMKQRGLTQEALDDILKDND